MTCPACGIRADALAGACAECGDDVCSSCAHSGRICLSCLQQIRAEAMFPDEVEA